MSVPQSPLLPPGFHFGAVYFRKSNPPREDWERDHRTAAEDGQTLFRHWVPWNAVEVAPGRFDWDDYDRQMDLAEKHGIRVVLAEMLIDFPEWLIHELPDARIEGPDGRRRESEMHVSCATGGHHALCLDHAAVRGAAEAYLAALASRYRGHPALLGYDIWNECTFYVADRLCYCPVTQARFRDWLRGRYGTVEELGRAWKRHSLTDWEQAALPRRPTLYPDFLDAVRFHNDAAFEAMYWRRDVLKAHAPDALVVAHGNGRSFADISPACGDDWRAAERVEVFGYTHYFGSGCPALLAADLIRGASDGKPFWRAEAVGDSQWMGRRPAVPTPSRDAMADPANLRFDCLVTMAAGGSAYQTPRWRPLLDGPLFGSFGWYDMDGRRTERSEEMAVLARWARSPEVMPLWGATPARGEVGLLLLEEAQAWCYAFTGDTDLYSHSVQGAWQAFTDAGIACDFVRAGQLGRYDLLYVPFPVAVSDGTLAALRAWVEAGGALVSEACFGYFDDRAHAFPRQPSRGADVLFGCDEESVSFAPDRWATGAPICAAVPFSGALYRQAYRPKGGGVAAGWHEGNAGEVAAVENRCGDGRTLLVGTMPGYAYSRGPGGGTGGAGERAQAIRDWSGSLPAWAGRPAPARADVPGLTVRLWQTPEPGGNTYVWVLNPGADAAAAATVRLPGGAGPFTRAEALRGEVVAAPPAEGTITVSVAGRDAAVVRLTR
jgi:beta-galactosidase